jgi:hypothetical protein
LIKKFIDPNAGFLFLPRDQVMEIAQMEQAIPFHVPEAEWGQRTGQIGFEAIVAKYENTHLAVQRMSDIIWAAEKRGTAPEAVGLYAIIHGFFFMDLEDGKALELEIPIFDTLYRCCSTFDPYRRHNPLWNRPFCCNREIGPFV